MSPHPLTNFEIQKYYQNEPKFNSVSSRNNLPKINLDDFQSIGTHWIALHVNGNNGSASYDAIYFDSFGVEHIPKAIKSYFLFDGGLYQQVDSVAMGSPLGPKLANIFLCNYEDIWLRNCSLECKPSYYKCYVDDIFVLCESESQIEPFKKIL